MLVCLPVVMMQASGALGLQDGAIWQTPLHAGASIHSWLGGIVMALRARLRR